MKTTKLMGLLISTTVWDIGISRLIVTFIPIPYLFILEAFGYFCFSFPIWLKVQELLEIICHTIRKEISRRN